MTPHDALDPEILTRRAFATGVCGVAFAALRAMAAPAHANGGETAIDKALADILGATRPVTGPIKFDIPEYAENGMMVAYTIAVDSPMTDSAFVRAIHLLSSANVKPVLSIFRFSAYSGKASVSGRVRLAKSQKVYAVAELSDGRVIMSEKMVNVTIGSCG